MSQSYLYGLSGQTHELPTSTPGPMSILLFFLVFISMNHLVRRIFASSTIDQQSFNEKNDSRQGFSIEDDDEDHQDKNYRSVDEMSPSSNDLIEIMIRNKPMGTHGFNPSDVSYSLRSNSIIRTAFFEPLSSHPTDSDNYSLPRLTTIPETWADAHRNLVHPERRIDRSTYTDDPFEISDSGYSS